MYAQSRATLLKRNTIMSTATSNQNTNTNTKATNLFAQFEEGEVSLSDFFNGLKAVEKYAIAPQIVKPVQEAISNFQKLTISTRNAKYVMLGEIKKFHDLMLSNYAEQQFYAWYEAVTGKQATAASKVNNIRCTLHVLTKPLGWGESTITKAAQALAMIPEGADVVEVLTEKTVAGLVEEYQSAHPTEVNEAKAIERFNTSFAKLAATINDNAPIFVVEANKAAANTPVLLLGVNDGAGNIRIVKPLDDQKKAAAEMMATFKPELSKSSTWDLVKVLKQSIRWVGKSNTDALISIITDDEGSKVLVTGGRVDAEYRVPDLGMGMGEVGICHEDILRLKEWGKAKGWAKLDFADVEDDDVEILQSCLKSTRTITPAHGEPIRLCSPSLPKYSMVDDVVTPSGTEIELDSNLFKAMFDAVENEAAEKIDGAVYSVKMIGKSKMLTITYADEEKTITTVTTLKSVFNQVKAIGNVGVKIDGVRVFLSSRTDDVSVSIGI
jgi:hypothetical protein